MDFFWTVSHGGGGGGGDEVPVVIAPMIVNLCLTLLVPKTASPNLYEKYRKMQIFVSKDFLWTKRKSFYAMGLEV